MQIWKISLPLIFAILLYTGPGRCQQSSTSEVFTNNKLLLIIDSLLHQGYQDKMFPGIGLAVYKGNSTQFLNYGSAKMASKEAVSKQTKFQLGSIGKLITAISVLQLVDQGKLEMKTDISQYIEELGLDLGTKDNPVTLHCLLTHSCGFNDSNIGYMARDQLSVLPLIEYVKKTNPGLFQTPGTDITYSNFSYAIAGYIVQKLANTEFATYADRNIFNPLGMTNSTLDFPYGYETEPGYANAYIKTKEGYYQTQIYPRHATPAGSLVSTVEDMGLFIRALFNQDPNLLSASSWELFYTQQFTNHPLLNGYGYGLEHQNINGKSSWAKGGMLPGVLSHILIVPDEFAIFSVVNTDDDKFGESFYKTIFDKAFPDTTSVKDLMKNVSTKKYTGIYRDKRYNRRTEENIVSLFRSQWTVYDNKTNDSLVVYHNGKWNSYLPVNEGVFQNHLLPYEYLVFKENEKGEIISLYRNLNIGGLSIPTSYEKTTWYNNPMYINEFYGFVPLFVFTGLFFMISSLFARLIRVWRKDFFRSKELTVRFHMLFSTIIILFISHTILVPWLFVKNIQEFLLGYPNYYKIGSLMGYLLIPLAIGLGFYIWKIWNYKQGNIFSRCYLTLVETSLLIHIVFLFYWNFL